MFEDKQFIITDRREALSKKAAGLIFSEMEEFTHSSMKELSGTYWHNRHNPDKVIQDEMDKGASLSDVVNYYRETSQYLYELGYWEAQQDKQREFKKLYMACKLFCLRHVLDYGGGVGGLAIYLTGRGITCDYLDIPGKTFDFAKFRFMKRGLNINMHNGLEMTTGCEYDAVICHDVLEHVFDIKDTVKTINNLITCGGFFIHRSTFGTGGIHLKKHSAYRDFNEFNELLTSCGFEFIGRIKADRLSVLAQKAGLRYTLFGIRLSKKMKYGGNFLLHKKALSP